jgi:hypothetical protein
VQSIYNQPALIHADAVRHRRLTVEGDVFQLKRRGQIRNDVVIGIVIEFTVAHLHVIRAIGIIEMQRG